MAPLGLVELAQNGDQQALNRLLKDWYTRIYNFSYKYFADQSLAEEATQRTFIAVHQNLSQLREPERFKSWIYQIASNHCHDEQRRRKRQRWLSIFSAERRENEAADYLRQIPSHRTAEQLKQSEMAAILRKALASISEEQRLVVIMKEYEGLKFREIAEALNISENTAKSRLYYGLKALRRILDKWNITQENTYYNG